MKKKLYQMSRINMELIKLAGGKFQPEELIGCRYYGKVYEGILRSMVILAELWYVITGLEEHS